VHYRKKLLGGLSVIRKTPSAYIWKRQGPFEVWGESFRGGCISGEGKGEKEAGKGQEPVRKSRTYNVFFPRGRRRKKERRETAKIPFGDPEGSAARGEKGGRERVISFYDEEKSDNDPECMCLTGGSGERTVEGGIAHNYQPTRGRIKRGENAHSIKSGSREGGWGGEGVCPTALIYFLSARRSVDRHLGF